MTEKLFVAMGPGDRYGKGKRCEVYAPDMSTAAQRAKEKMKVSALSCLWYVWPFITREER